MDVGQLIVSPGLLFMYVPVCASQNERSLFPASTASFSFLSVYDPRQESIVAGRKGRAKKLGVMMLVVIVHDSMDPTCERRVIRSESRSCGHRTSSSATRKDCILVPDATTTVTPFYRVHVSLTLYGFSPTRLHKKHKEHAVENMNMRRLLLWQLRLESNANVENVLKRDTIHDPFFVRKGEIRLVAKKNGDSLLLVITLWASRTDQGCAGRRCLRRFKCVMAVWYNSADVAPSFCT